MTTNSNAGNSPVDRKVMRDYVDSKNVKINEIKERFRMIKEFTILRGDLSECGNCGDNVNTKRLPSEPWTSSLYCWKLPIQSLNTLQYTHEKLYSEKAVIGLMKAAYYDGHTAFKCVGVIDSEGGIYPGPLEPGTQVFVEWPNAVLRGAEGVPLENTVMQQTED